MNYISNWIKTFCRSWAERFSIVFHDAGVLVFFLLLPLSYPLVYTIIYNPEVIRDVPVAVVDDCRTADSRQVARMLDASPYTEVHAYAANMEEARRMMKERSVYAIVEIPSDFSQRIGRMEQAVMPVYCDMSLLFRYRSVLLAVTDIQLDMGADLRTRTIDESPVAVVAGSMGETVGNDFFPLGDVTQGFASFIMIGVLVLIIQQSLILGVMMIGGGAAERRRRNRGIDPLATPGPTSASVLGSTLCYVVIYLPIVFFVLHYVPQWFSLPHFGSWHQWFPFMLPMLFASALLGETLSPLCTERESSFLVWAFTSVAFLFLSGLTWPVSSMNPFWHIVSGLVPAAWGVQGFLQINSNDATLAQVGDYYRMLWILSAAYFIMAVCVHKLVARRALRRYA